MNIAKITATLAVAAGLGAAGFVASTPARAQTPPAPPTVPGPAREKHPELRRALATLKRTETQLRRSARDFGGHREKAADLCHQAQQEIQLALQSDRA